MCKLSIYNLFQQLSSKIQSQSFLETSRKSIFAFIRNRKLPFTDIINIILSSKNRSIQTEIDEYFDKKEVEPVSRQAFAKQRENIKPEAFYELNNTIIDQFENVDTEIATYKGYRLFSADGTLIDLPNTEALRNEFGFSTNGTDKIYAKGLAITAFDVLNKLTIFAKLYRYDDSEKKRIFDVVNTFHDKGYDNCIWLLDRGYPSFKLFSQFELNNQKFVVRVSSNSLAEINSANEFDQIVSVTRGKITLKLRVVNIDLENGLIEKLVTNLDDFSYGEFKELYAKRWNIETNYRFMKHKLELEVFTGETITAILQDFYAAILLLNISAVVEREQEDVIFNGDKDKNLKNVYHANKTKIISDIKRDLVKLLLCDNPFSKIFTQYLLYSRIKRYAYHAAYKKSFSRANHSSRRSRRLPHPKKSL